MNGDILPDAAYIAAYPVLDHIIVTETRKACSESVFMSDSHRSYAACGSMDNDKRMT